MTLNPHIFFAIFGCGAHFKSEMGRNG